MNCVVNQNLQSSNSIATICVAMTLKACLIAIDMWAQFQSPRNEIRGELTIESRSKNKPTPTFLFNDLSCYVTSLQNSHSVTCILNIKASKRAFFPNYSHAQPQLLRADPITRPALPAVSISGLCGTLSGSRLFSNDPRKPPLLHARTCSGRRCSWIIGKIPPLN